MRKDNRIKKRVNSPHIKGVYSYYEVKGLNLGKFTESLRRNGIALFNVKKKGNDRLIFAIKISDREKLFAIIKDVWYNTYKIRKIKDGGINYPLFFLFKNLGLAIGIVLFFVACLISDDYIFSFSFTGSGSVYQREITEYLNKSGVYVYSRFSGLDLKTLEDAILSSNKNLSFVSCYKSGNRLIIDSALSSPDTGRLSGKETELLSEIDGVLESIKVYRGTAVKSAGETVMAGETIVAGYADVKETRVSVNVIAVATVRYTEEYIFTLIKDVDDAAVSFAEELSGKIPCAAEINKTEEDGNYIYTVKLSFLKVITVG